MAPPGAAPEPEEPAAPAVPDRPHPARRADEAPGPRPSGAPPAGLQIAGPPAVERAGVAGPVVGPRPRLGDLVAAGALYAATLFLVVYLTEGRLLEGVAVDPHAFLWLQGIDDGILTAVALLFGLLRFPRSWRALGFRRVSWRWWGIGAGAGVGAAAAAWAVSTGLERLGWPAPAHPVEEVLAGVTSSTDLLFILLAVTIPVPIGEETFFRGFAYRVLRARLGLVAAIGLTALLFALVHGVELGSWLPVFPVGLVFAVLVERSGSLLPAMVGHAVVNALAVLAA